MAGQNFIKLVVIVEAGEHTTA